MTPDIAVGDLEVKLVNGAELYGYTLVCDAKGRPTVMRN